MPRVAPCQNVRSAILDAARSLMETHGFKKTTIDDIAQEVGIGKATIYGYFENKQEIALAVVNAYHMQIHNRWEEILLEDAPLADRIRQMLVAKVAMAFDTASRYHHSLDESLACLRPLVLSRREAWLAMDVQILSKLVQEGMGENLFVQGNPETFARTLLTCVLGLMPYSLSRQELACRDQVVDQANQIVDMVLLGLYARSDHT